LIGRRFRRPLSMPSAIFGIYVGGWPSMCQDKIILFERMKRSLNLTTIHVPFFLCMLRWRRSLTASDLSGCDIHTPSLRVRAFLNAFSCVRGFIFSLIRSLMVLRAL
jgi:hypothetical protein